MNRLTVSSFVSLAVLTAIFTVTPPLAASAQTTNVAGAWSFLGIFRRELDALALAQQLEHRTADRAAVKKVFDAAFVADEPEPLVDQEPCNCPGWHSRTPPVPKSLVQLG